MTADEPVCGICAGIAGVIAGTDESPCLHSAFTGIMSHGAMLVKDMEEADRHVLRLALVTRQLLVGHALALALEERGDMKVVLLHPDAPDLADRCREIPADVVLLVLEQAPAARVAALHRALPEGRIAVMGEQADMLTVADCLAEGATGFLTVDATLPGLATALQDISEGQLRLPRMGRLGARAGSPAPGDATGDERSYRESLLTAREREVLRRLTAGESTAAIARGMQVSINTTRTHIQNILNKLDVHSRVELAAYAARRGWTE